MMPLHDLSVSTSYAVIKNCEYCDKRWSTFTLGGADLSSFNKSCQLPPPTPWLHCCQVLVPFSSHREVCLELKLVGVILNDVFVPALLINLGRTFYV